MIKFSLRVNSKASILILTLWALCLVASFAVIIGSGIRQKMLLVRRLNERDLGYLLCEAAAKTGISVIRQHGEEPFMALKESWSNNPGAFKAVNLGDGQFSVCYIYTDECRSESALRYGMMDEERKINVNTADAEVMARLFMAVVCDLQEPEALEMAEAIVDWRDSDQGGGSLGGGAEDFYYRGLQFPYSAKNANIQVLDELLLIKGFPVSVFNTVSEYLTVYGSGRINVNTASKPVLVALGLDDELSQKIIGFRAGEDTIEATEDDRVFKSADTIAADLIEVYHLSESEIVQLGKVSAQHLDVSSQHFMIKSTADIGSRKGLMKATCVIDAEGKILYWQES